MVTRQEIEAGRTPKGGFTRAQLAKWGVPWPPKKGWKKRLIEQGGTVKDRKTDLEYNFEISVSCPRCRAAPGSPCIKISLTSGDERNQAREIACVSCRAQEGGVCRGGRECDQRVEDWCLANPTPVKNRFTHAQRKAAAKPDVPEVALEPTPPSESKAPASYTIDDAEKKRIKNHAKKWGITPEADYYLLWRVQHGRCFICVQPETYIHPRGAKPQALSLDHDHGHCPSSYGCVKCIRFFLCRECNTRLGRVERREEEPTPADIVYIRLTQMIRDGHMDHPLSKFLLDPDRLEVIAKTGEFVEQAIGKMYPKA